MSNVLHETSAFRINTVSKVTELWNTAQKTLNVQLGISAALSKALMVSGIGLLIAGIAALITVTKKWRKEQEETARINKIVTGSLKEAALEGTKSAQKEIISLELLYKVLSLRGEKNQDRRSCGQIAGARKIKASQLTCKALIFLLPS